VVLTHVLFFFHLLGAIAFFAGAAVAGTLLWASFASGLVLLAILALMVWQPA
jgi:hypothetical protein